MEWVEYGHLRQRRPFVNVYSVMARQEQATWSKKSITVINKNKDVELSTYFEMHNNTYWLNLRTRCEKLELIRFNERSDRLRVIMRLEHCIGWMTRLEHCIGWMTRLEHCIGWMTRLEHCIPRITRVKLEYDEIARLKWLLAPWNFLTMTSDVKWLVVIFTYRVLYHQGMSTRLPVDVRLGVP